MKEIFFDNYKITNLQLITPNDIGLISSQFIAENYIWDHKFDVLMPAKHEESNNYFSGLKVETICKQAINDDKIVEVIKLTISIMGIFRFAEEEISEEEAAKTLIILGSSVLLPYLRSHWSSILATSGFGSSVFPLYNIGQTLEKNYKGQFKLTIVKDKKLSDNRRLDDFYTPSHYNTKSEMPDTPLN